MVDVNNVMCPTRLMFRMFSSYPSHGGRRPARVRACELVEVPMDTQPRDSMVARFASNTTALVALGGRSSNVELGVALPSVSIRAALDLRISESITRRVL